MNRTTATNLACALALLAVMLVTVFATPTGARLALSAVAAIAILAAAFFYSCWQSAGPSEWEDTGASAWGGAAASDPWAMQRELMRASDQKLPSAPVVSKNSLMYAALVMEEGAETFCQGLVPALDRIIPEYAARVPSAAADGGKAHVEHLERVRALKVIRGKLQECGFVMTSTSRIMRQHLRDLPDFAFPLSYQEAVPLYDGVTDLAVVNCGLCLASGLDGAAGYEEVATSNLSKRNPDTGLIDKTPDGKWIKGREYREPDLGAILMARKFA